VEVCLVAARSQYSSQLVYFSFFGLNAKHLKFQLCNYNTQPYGEYITIPSPIASIHIGHKGFESLLIYFSVKRAAIMELILATSVENSVGIKNPALFTAIRFNAILLVHSFLYTFPVCAAAGTRNLPSSLQRMSSGKTKC